MSDLFKKAPRHGEAKWYKGNPPAPGWYPIWGIYNPFDKTNQRHRHAHRLGWWDGKKWAYTHAWIDTLDIQRCINRWDEDVRVGIEVDAKATFQWSDQWWLK